MSGEGIGLPAIARILDLEERVRELHLRVRDLEDRMRSELERRPGARVFAAGATGSVVTLRHGTRMRRATELVVWNPLRPLQRGSDAEEPADSGDEDDAYRS
jgi:MerR family transcriptional regulator/heat shock protein HspR